MIKDQKLPYMKEGEHIEMVVHRHWIIFIFKIIYLLFLIASSILLFMISDKLIYLFGTFGAGLFWTFMSLYWMFFFTFIFLSWINDELDLFIITNERIIGIEQTGALSRKVSECNIDCVQEVNAEVSGIMQTLFGYGHIHIHTASEHSDMIVFFAPHPIESGRRINGIIGEFRKAHGIASTIKPKATTP